MRRALDPLAVYPVCQDAGLQVATNQPQHPLVRNSLGQPIHQDVVVDPVEELLQIHVHHSSEARLHMLLCRQDRLMRTSPRPEAVTMFAEGRIDQRLQHL